MVAGRSNTSLAAACVRLNEVGDWRRTLLHWSQSDRSWGFNWAAGLPAGFGGRIGSATTTGESLDHAGRQGGDQRIKLPVRINSRQYGMVAEVSVRRGSALALVPHGELERSVPSKR